VQTKEELLEWWQEIRRPLSPDEQVAFLEKCEQPGIRDLLELPPLAVRSAFEVYSRLEFAVAYARKILSEQPTRNEYRNYGPTGKPSSSGGLQNSAPAGVPGAPATYQSGLARNPSAPEATTRDRCEHCDAHIPNGAVHDKCHG
jgi:hypothetical protein